MSSERVRRTILLTGANGQVGWELQRSLATLGHVVATGRGELDLTSADQMRRFVRKLRPDLIVNAAAYTAVDRAETDRKLARELNGVAPGVLATEVGRLGGAIIHYSTDYVFDGGGDRPWRENDHPRPINAYGESKLMGEQAIVASGCPHLILRTSWVYGIHGTNFVKTMLREGKLKAEVSVVVDQIGAPTSAKVIADATTQILAQGRGEWRSLLEGRGGVIHLACRGFTSWYGFADEIFRQARAQNVALAVKTIHPIPTAQSERGARRPLNSRLDCSRLLKRFDLLLPPWEMALLQSLPLENLGDEASARPALREN